jgi:hypothetical protein
VALMSEILAQALEAEPTDENVWRATRRSADSTDLAERLLTIYREADLEPVPLKEADEFRPAFLNDYVGNQGTPYDREFAFVGRALCYADSIAVVDELASWERAYEHDAQAVRTNWSLGFPECNDGTWAARRIARYRQLEEDGLIFYVNPPQYRTRGEIAAMLNWSDVAPLRELVVERMGYRSSVVDHPAIILGDLTVWFRELIALLEHVAKLSNNVDLYLPSWFAGPELLNWWYEAGGALLPKDKTPLRHHRHLTRLLMLPALTADAVRDLDHSDLLAIRQDDAFQLWRTDLQDALQALTDSPDIFSSADYEALLRDRAQTLARRLDNSRAIRPKIGTPLVTGITTAAVAALMNEEVGKEIALATAPLVALLLVPAARWLLSGPRAQGSAAAADAHYRLFIDGNVRTLSSEIIYDRPPSSNLVDFSGRPVYFAPWDA